MCPCVAAMVNPEPHSAQAEVLFLWELWHALFFVKKYPEVTKFSGVIRYY